MPRITPATLDTARQAARYLTEHGQGEYADAVTAVIEAADPKARRAPGGRWKRPESLGPLDQPLSLYVEKALWQRVVAAGDPTGDVVEGLEKTLAGEFVPTKPKRAGWGQAPEKMSTSVRAPKELVERVEQYAAEHQDELGWAPKARQIVVVYLAHKYPAPENAAAE